MKVTLRRITDAQWSKWCEESTSLPVTCDPDWAHAILSIPTAPSIAIPFIAADSEGEALIVGYPTGSLLSDLTLSPLGLSAAFDYRGNGGSPRRLLREFLTRQRYRWRSIGFVRPIDWTQDDGLPKPDVVFSGETHLLDLSAGYERLFAGTFKGATRTCIRRAEDQGVEVRRATSTRDVSEYFRVHSELAAAKGGYVDLYPEVVFSRLLASSRVRLMLALADERVIGGGVFLDDGPRTFYWHAAADRAYASLQPAYAILSRAINDSISRAKDYMDFGSSAGIDSLRRFKESWGAIPASQTSVSYRHPFVRRLKALSGA